jgi:hypothetical protein
MVALSGGSVLPNGTCCFSGVVVSMIYSSITLREVFRLDDYESSLGIIVLSRY